MQSACLRPTFCDVRMQFLRRKGRPRPRHNSTDGVLSGWPQLLGRGGGGCVATARTGRSWGGSHCAQTKRTGAHGGAMGLAVPPSTGTRGAGCGAPAACGGRVVASAAPVSVTALLGVEGEAGGGGRMQREAGCGVSEGGNGETAQRKRASDCEGGRCRRKKCDRRWWGGAKDVGNGPEDGGGG